MYPLYKGQTVVPKVGKLKSDAQPRLRSVNTSRESEVRLVRLRTRGPDATQCVCLCCGSAVMPTPRSTRDAGRGVSNLCIPHHHPRHHRDIGAARSLAVGTLSIPINTDILSRFSAVGAERIEPDEGKATSVCTVYTL